MYIINRVKAGGGFNVKRNRFGAFQRLVRDKIAGYGVGKELYHNIDKGKKNIIQHLTQPMENLSVRRNKPKKYISLNL
jgi:hypothetical protein